MNLTYLLNCWSEMRDFAMDSYYLKSFATEAERLPASLNNLKVMMMMMSSILMMKIKYFLFYEHLYFLRM
ncbi:hypothetical protein P3S67_030546 [Capsicum chacoense]